MTITDVYNYDWALNKYKIFYIEEVEIDRVKDSKSERDFRIVFENKDYIVVRLDEYASEALLEVFEE